MTAATSYVTPRRRDAKGFTLLELTIAVAIAAIIVVALSGLLNSTLQMQDEVAASTAVEMELAEAMRTMVKSVEESPTLLLPFYDNPNTDWTESLREQTIPASAPEGSSTFASAVLAVTASPLTDIDNDGWADSNNDKDYLDRNDNGSRDAGEPERIDEDPGGDATNDNAAGIYLLDDDGDGDVDEGTEDQDDDEDGSKNEDNVDFLDNDGDGKIDEDYKKDLTADGEAGIEGVDDDYDGSIDEGDKNDDDEDGSTDEDPLEVVAFYLSGGTLIQRIPAYVDVDSSGEVDGRDYYELTLVDDVSHFRVELLSAIGQPTLLDISLSMTRNGATSTLSTKVRLGAAL